jgi:hypothetical protein
MNMNGAPKRIILLFLTVISLIATSLACGQTVTPIPALTPDNAATTVAALATMDAHLMTQVAAQESENAVLVTQVAGLATVSAYQATQIAARDETISYLATRVGALPLPTRGPIPTMTPYQPVRGSVAIEWGRCCTDGIAGEMIQVNVVFEASGPVTEVTEMRVRVGTVQFEESDMAETEWLPFESLKAYPVPVVVNWTSFYVSVQYRDAQGNVSPVYHDDIWVEGHLPLP